VLVEDFLVLGF